MKHFITRHLHFIIMMCFSVALSAQNAWINEFHYDNEGTDLNEFVELVVENPGTYNLSLFSLVLYNGSSTVRTPYDTVTLNLFTQGSATGNFVFYYYNYPADGIQNGAPDGMALVYDGMVITGQFLSYEGSFVAASGPAAGMTSVDIGVAESGTTPSVYSLQLSGPGSEYADFTWLAPATATAGVLNNGQTLYSGGVLNPTNFDAVTNSQTQINLSWLQNDNGNNVMVAASSSNSFVPPSGVYEVGDMVGTATVIYIGSLESWSHTGLAAENQYFYKAWSFDGDFNYSPGVIDSAYTQSLEPSNHPTGLTASCNGPAHITVSWTDSDAAHYLVKGSSSGYGGIVPPVDGVGQGDSLLVKNADANAQPVQFTGLAPNTTYYFKTYPYNGSGVSSNYKTDGDIPGATATTDGLEINLVITEVTHPKDANNAKFVELMNLGTDEIDFSITPVYLSRQANGGTWEDILLVGIVAPGATYVIGNNNADFPTSYGFSADLYSTNISGNGDDGYFLFNGGPHASGSLLDSYGVINQDGSGQPWEYTEKKAVRKRGVSSPNSTWTASEWVILPVAAYVKDMTPGYHNGTITWQGASSANWNAKGSNWNSPNGYIPDASCNVIIPGSAVYPIVTEHSACKEVEIQTGSTLSIQGTGTLRIVGQ